MSNEILESNRPLTGVLPSITQMIELLSTDSNVGARQHLNRLAIAKRTQNILTPMGVSSEISEWVLRLIPENERTSLDGAVAAVQS